APDIAGRNIANPTAMILAAVLMLEHIGQSDVAARVRTALETVLREKRVQTPDLGGTATTDAFTDAVIRQIG
ncbi:MAG: isocitrate/isopropylmalate family dehydrogenase, partial [Longimicrobiales bacterium]